MANTKKKSTEKQVAGEFTTDFGKVVFRPFLVDKGRYDKNEKSVVIDNDRGAHSISIGFPIESDFAKTLKKFIKGLNDEAHAVFPDGDKKALPFKEIDGMLVLNVDNSYQAPIVIDAATALMSQEDIARIASGSIAKVKFYHQEVEGFGKSGIKLYLKKIQVKELKAFGEVDDDFDVEEGGFVAPVSAPSTEVVENGSSSQEFV